ncbi:hypothetical protein L9F63_018348, partial [Diploptera punctata]
VKAFRMNGLGASQNANKNSNHGGEMSEEVERDAGFCSGEDLEDPLEPEDDLHSPTDVSEDSVEVKVLPISLRNIKNKRKCAEPRKVPSEDDDVLPPYKKRQDTPRPPSVTSLPVASSPSSPFRPWNKHAIPPPSTQDSQQLISRCPSVSISTPSPPPQSYTPTRLPHVPAPRRCQSASVTASSSPSTPDLPQNFNDRVPSLHHQEEPLSLVLKNGPSEGEKPIERRERRPTSSPIPPQESRIHPTDIAHETRLRLEIPTRYDNVRFCGPNGAVMRNLTPVERYGVPHVRALHERHGVFPINRPIPSETIVRCPSSVSRQHQRFEAVDFTQNGSASISRRTLSECEDRVDVEDLSSGLKQRTNNAKFSVESLLGSDKDHKIHDDEKPGPSSIASTSSNNNEQKNKQIAASGGQQRNYKNMTRERRIEANARERTRVHTISAAFDTLRRAIPAYSHNQKLSKLSVLRIACSYILTLSRVAGVDYSADQSQPSLSDCVDLVSRTIQTEGKLRRKKDD